MKLKERILSGEYMIIGCNVAIFGCGLMILAYLYGLIGMFITPKIYFSDLYSSTVQTLLVVVILFLIIEKRNIHRRLLKEKDTE